jgi:hypothetical protein
MAKDKDDPNRKYVKFGLSKQKVDLMSANHTSQRQKPGFCKFARHSRFAVAKQNFHIKNKRANLAATKTESMSSLLHTTNVVLLP